MHDVKIDLKVNLMQLILLKFHFVFKIIDLLHLQN